MSMNNLVNAYAALSDYRQAATLYVEVLACEADHPPLRDMSMNNLMQRRAITGEPRRFMWKSRDSASVGWVLTTPTLP
jgi:hypothetical protein